MKAESKTVGERVEELVLEAIGEVDAVENSEHWFDATVEEPLDAGALEDVPIEFVSIEEPLREGVALEIKAARETVSDGTRDRSGRFYFRERQHTRLEEREDDGGAAYLLVVYRADGDGDELDVDLLAGSIISPSALEEELGTWSETNRPSDAAKKAWTTLPLSGVRERSALVDRVLPARDVDREELVATSFDDENELENAYENMSENELENGNGNGDANDRANAGENARDLEREVFECILEETTGEDGEPITSSEIASRVGIDDGKWTKRTRDIIKKLVKERKVPIAASGNGYFLLEDPAELGEYLSGLDARIEGTKARKQSVTEAWNRFRYERDDDGNIRSTFGFDEDDVPSSDERENDQDGGRWAVVDSSIGTIVEDGFESEEEALAWARKWGFGSDFYQVDDLDEEADRL